MSGQEYRIVRAEARHAAEMARRHREVFPDEVITLLGEGFLRLHHDYYARHPGGACWLAVREDTGAIGGFVIGGVPELRRAFILRYALRLGGTVLWRALVDPRIRRRIRLAVKRLFRRLVAGAPTGAAQEPAEPPAGTWSFLLFLGVCPSLRGKGAGSALLRAYREDGVRRGYGRMRLTVAEDNAAAIALYRKNGWIEVGQAEGMRYYEQVLQAGR